METTLLQGPPLAAGRTAEIYQWGEKQVVKLFRPGMPPGMAEKEAATGRIVADAGVGAPAVGEVVSVDGRPGIVYARIDGESMLHRLQRQPWTVWAQARTLGQLHARMHGVARPQLAAARDYLQRDIGRAQELTAELRAAVLARLQALPDADAICHGDFHPDNVLLTRDGPVILDWMTAGHGNPDADVARTVLMLRQGQPMSASALQLKVIELLRQQLLSGYLRAYRAVRACPDSAIETWVPVIAAARLSEGIETEREQLLALAARALK